MAFDQSTRNRLQKFVSESRTILTEEFTRQLQANYGMDPKNGSVAGLASLGFLDNQGRQTAIILRETLEHYKAALTIKSEKEKNKQGIERIIREQSFTVLNRLGALRMAEARGFLLESVANGYSSKGFQLYKNLAGSALGETGDAYRQYLFSIFDEFSKDLAVLFDRNSSQGLLFPRESSLLSLLDQINHFEIENLWAEDETIGWIYQYFNSQEERKKMRAESQAPRNSRELAVRNQFFTPRYVVEFLTDNTLGRIWYEMTQGKTALVESCRFMVRRPNEIFLAKGESVPDNSENQESLSQEELIKQPVFIPFRGLKDPRELRMLDPACGSMHFGLYAFDLFEKIYEEAWNMELKLGADQFIRSKGLKPLQTTYSSYEEFLKSVPKLIIECNIHGVDIDPRAVQIAGLSLWQRAQRSWYQMGIRPNQRPSIKKSNIVCAEPMPGEKEMLLEFTTRLNPPILRQLVETIFDKMELSGEAGSLLKIEEEISSIISAAQIYFTQELLRRKEEKGFFPGMAPKQEITLFDFADLPDKTSFWDTAEERILMALSDYANEAESVDSQKRMFAEDATKGFAFINLCRNKFDVVLMNPPFGEPSSKSKRYIDDNYPRTKGDVLANFIERAIQLTGEAGLIGAITSRTCLFLSSMSGLREEVFGINAEINLCADLGDGVLDAMVETAAYTISKNRSIAQYVRLVMDDDKQKTLENLCRNSLIIRNRFFVTPEKFRKLSTTPYCYWVDERVLDKLALPSIDPEVADVKVGLQTGDDFRFLRNFWECPIDSDEWVFFSKTEEAIAWHSPIQMKIRWVDEGYELKNFTDDKGKQRSALRSPQQYFKPGFSYMLRSSRLVPYIVPKGCIPTAGRSQVFPHEGKEIDVLAICASNIGSAVARFRGEMFARPKFQAGMVQALPYKELNDKIKKNIENFMMLAIAEAKAYYSYDETTLDYLGVKTLEAKQAPQTSFTSLIGAQNELQIAECFGIDEDEYDDLTLDLQQAVSKRKNASEANHCDLLKESSLRLLSYLVGCAFGRWDIDFDRQHSPADIYAELPKQSPAFKTKGSKNYIESYGIADIDSENSLILSIEAIATGKNEEIDKAFILCGVNDWNQFLSKSALFFDYHYNQYSQNRRSSPIYWQLQTSSGSYTLWVYYHRLTDQTLYSCVNDFIEPKLKTVSHYLSDLLNKSARSSTEEKELSRLTDFVVELRDFRDELLRLAKFWKPNLNDGVQITAAPLWRLFQHKPWQKKLKETWDKLEKGEYDWAHLAYSIWPERVLRKCHNDRSLAIAHDVEIDFWEEIEMPVIRRGKDTGETKVEWKPKKLTENELNELIIQKIAELKQ